ncbi:uncharacterized protein (DUF924 family) [Loktanella sp. PT4BL]|jgi:uncharacterized protein (DUF924 family)|uniref:DUF924 family protein n=1 Tax=Loktanella sp. PT4BL TaxID=2135611 RepID=UPI000D759357|nr:DUF924 family protein [Loktanella sp. PT4BL]PXW72600.1 uncharacterized protein (DUF924 family) [Loktanella sp. PT4BL]
MADHSFKPDQVLDLWFPDNGFWESEERFSAWIEERMYGGMDETIIQNHADLTRAAARSELDHWADTAEGRIALLIALDQFPRSLWRDTPGAYAQDIKANRLVLEGIANGHFAAVKPWKKLFYLIALGHCEGPDHLDRIALIDELSETLISEMPAVLANMGDSLRAQNTRVRGVIERFGRHPHRNVHYGRVSSADEESYISTGDFPHLPRTEPTDGS